MTNALPQAIEIHTGLHAYPTLKSHSEAEKGITATVLFKPDQPPKPEDIFFIHKTRFVQMKEPKTSEEGAGVYKLALMDEAEYMKTPEFIKAASFGVRKISPKYYTSVDKAGNGNYEFIEVEKTKPFQHKEYDLFSYKDGDLFTITEAITGAKIYAGKKFKEVVTAALEILSKNPLDEGIKDKIQRNGISPRYCFYQPE